MTTREIILQCRIAWLEFKLDAYEKEFNRILNAKNSSDLLFERIFNEKKYPEFHTHLWAIHELWILGVPSPYWNWLFKVKGL